MKKMTVLVLALNLAFAVSGCKKAGEPENNPAATAAQAPSAPQGQAQVKDDVSQKNIVQIASGNENFKTLVTALKAAELVDVLANPGPFTVFAPNDAAFAKLPAGTVEGLVKPEKKEALQDILQYHVNVGNIKLEYLKDGQVLNQVNGGNVTITIKDGKTFVNGTPILATVPASNGVIYVIDTVLLPPAAPATPAQK